MGGQNMQIHGKVLLNIISSWLKGEKVEPSTEERDSAAVQPLNCNLQFDLAIEKGDHDGSQK
jgi:hypothetical protein